MRRMFRSSKRVHPGSSSSSRSSSRSKSASSSRSRRVRQQTRKNRLNRLREDLVDKHSKQIGLVEELREEWQDISHDKSDAAKKAAAFKRLNNAEKEQKKMISRIGPLEDLTEVGLGIFEKIEDDSSLSKDQKRALKKRYTALNDRFKSTLGRGSARNEAEINRTMKELDDFEQMVNSGNIRM